MDQKTKTIILGGIAILIIASVLGVFIRLSRSPRDNARSSSNPLPQLQTTTGVSVSPMPSTRETPVNTKIISIDGLSLAYPNNWGVLTCSNSKNFEFDPANSNDLKNVVCGDALKPVTVLSVNRLNCAGAVITLGSYQVTKSKTTTPAGDVNYRWCLSVGGVNLDITHRVSNSGSRATSKIDYSTQVEQMIQVLQISRGS